jgi:dTDP-4-amino-4,6-dideoxygalactose transaminase
MFKYSIPFSRVCLTGNEQAYVNQAVASGEIYGNGAFTRKCQDLFEKELGIRKAMLVTNGTHALELAALLLDIRPGDEVILPSFTFVSTANAFVLRGAHPVFIDIRPDTLNLDESRLESLITPRTKAIVPVHYAGVACEMSAILEIAQNHRLPVVEDNAHGLFGRYKGRALGTFGCLSAQSFDASKNITCGQGGTLFINDPKFIERAEMVRARGTNQNRFLRGEVDKYTWVDIGSNFVFSDLMAAFLCPAGDPRNNSF